MYLATPTRRRGLGRLGSQAMPLSLANPVSSDSNSCSYWDFFFNAPAWQTCQQGLAVAQIQTVPANAAAYGYPAAVVSAAQAAADAQIAQVPSDVADVATVYSAGTVATPASIPTWLYIAGAIAGGLLVIAAFK